MKVKRNFGLDIGSSYEIIGNELHVRESFGNVKVKIPLKEAVFSMKRDGVLGWLFNFGDISIRQDGIEQHKCTNISPCSDFLNALEKASLIGREEQRPELENFVICIPQLPTLLVDAIWEILRATMSVNKVLESDRTVKCQGDWVKKGEAIVLLGTAVVSPVDGRVQMMGGSTGHCQWPDGADWPQADQELFHTLAKIQPVKGSNLNDYITDAYKHVISFLENKLKEKRFLKRMAERSLSPLAERLGGFEPIAPYLHKTMDKLRNAKSRIEPLATE